MPAEEIKSPTELIPHQGNLLQKPQWLNFYGIDALSDFFGNCFGLGIDMKID